MKDRSYPIDVEIKQSARRHKTAQLNPTSTGVRVTVPASAPPEEQHRLVDLLVERYLRQQRSREIDLTERAKKLSRDHGFELPAVIKWVDNQQSRWGSCTPNTRTIRISSALNNFPLWVVDAIIAHELAHLTYRGHSPSFWKLANRYPLMERAKGYLIAKQDALSVDQRFANTAFDDHDDVEVVSDEPIMLPFGEYDYDDRSAFNLLVDDTRPARESACRNE